MSAYFSIDMPDGIYGGVELFYAQSDDAWAIEGYFKRIAIGDMPSSEPTKIYFDPKSGNLNGQIGYEDLAIYHKKIEEVFNTHLNSINYIKGRELIDYMKAVVSCGEELTKSQLNEIIDRCNDAKNIPMNCDLFSDSTEYNTEFWEFVECMYDVISQILKYHKEDYYLIHFCY